MNSNDSESSPPDRPPDQAVPQSVFQRIAELDHEKAPEKASTSVDSSPSGVGVSEQVFDPAIEYFKRSGMAVELFESMKMRLRASLKLPIIATEDQPRLPEAVQRSLENGLLDACRVAGLMLIKEGRIGEGWMYLRVLDDKAFTRRCLSSVAITNDSYDEMVQVLLHEGVDVRRGFRAVIDHQGTCDSVTVFDQVVAGRCKQDRREAATQLLDHLYDELTSLVQRDVLDRGKRPGHLDGTDKRDGRSGVGLDELLSQNPWLLREGGYHLDTTHLSAVVRNASVLDATESLHKAKQLVRYGRRLHHEFQYPGDEPFVDFYPAYAVFYDVLLGINVEAGLKVFQRKAETVDTNRHGTAAIETYVDLLRRTGKYHDAISEAIRLLPGDVSPQQVLSNLLEIAGQCEDQSVYDHIAMFCKSRQDVLGFTAAIYAKAQRR